MGHLLGCHRRVLLVTLAEKCGSRMVAELVIVSRYEAIQSRSGTIPRKLGLFCYHFKIETGGNFHG